MSADELGLNIIPRYSDMNIRFTNVTKDGSAINFSGVQVFIFGMGTTQGANASLVKASTGSTSGDFTINYSNSSVTVGVRASEIGYAKGTWYVSLIAQISGQRISHRSKHITIEDVIAVTGI